MSATGWYANGVCHETQALAIAAKCEQFTGLFASGGLQTSLTGTTFCTGLSSGANQANLTVSQLALNGVVQRSSRVPNVSLPSCSLEQPELFPLPSATDIGTVFAWGFSLVLVSYLAAWGLGTVLNFLKRN